MQDCDIEYPTLNKEYPIMKERKYDLQERFICYAVRIIKVAEALPNTKTGNHIRVQMLKSGTSPAANYGEAQSAESKADFIHKLKIALKELRETEIWLKIAFNAELIQPTQKLKPILDETDELISILFRSIETARKNETDNKTES